MSNKLLLCELMNAVEERMRQMNYGEASIYAYWHCWRGLIKYAEEKGETFFTVKLGEDYLFEKCHIDVYATEENPDIPKWKIKAFKRPIYVLADFQNSGVIVRQRRLSRIHIPPRFMEPAEHFWAVCRSRYNTERTIEQKNFTVKRFLLHLEQEGVYDIAKICEQDISSFLRTTVGWSQRTLATTICNLRQFLTFLYQEKYIVSDISKAVPPPNHGRGGKLPSIWMPAEVQKLLSAVDRANPVGKRDYAILLMVTQLGLRDSDIQNLKFENLYWKECLIRLVQTKTGRPLELPLSEEVGIAIIDYLKYGRPKQDTSEYVFIRHSAPYGKCGNYYHVMRKYLKKAGVSFDPHKSHGLHTLRHTLATRLLEQNIPLQTISEILGHTASDSTKVYLQVDLNGLRQCALNPDEVCGDD